MDTKTYLITGIDRRGVRFRKHCGTNLRYALAHNVWQGSLWEIVNGKRRRVHRWIN